MKFNDITGQQFKFLTVIKRDPVVHAGATFWLCQCSCGSIISVPLARLKNGRSGSCGCKKGKLITSKITRHGHYVGDKGSRTYNSYRSMIDRCNNDCMPNYHLYGGRGISVCARWMENFENFLKDMGERPIGKTLDRKNGSLGYEQSNCRWATPLEQMQNIRTNRFVSDGSQLMTIRQAATDSNIAYATFRRRLYSHGHSNGYILIPKPGL